MSHTTARVPGSKSETVRALFLAALADGRTTLYRPLDSEDTVAFAEGVNTLGFPVTRNGDMWTIEGRPTGPAVTEATVWCHHAGTAARFLPGLAALGKGRYVIDASDQMRARPMGPLLAALRQLGVGVTTQPHDRLPWVIKADTVPGGDVTIDAGTSSQYLTALCLIAPATAHGLRIHVTDLVSTPYLDLTLAMMRDFGAEVSRTGATITIPPGGYHARNHTIEPDASTASYFCAAAAVTGNAVTIPGLGHNSRQGDLRFATDVLPRMGCHVDVTADHTTVTGPKQLHSPGEVNMRDISDTMMTLAAIAPFTDAPVRITDVANCRVKECDRIDAITTALGACGITTRTGPDWLEIHPGTPHPARIETRNDHRIAMSMSVTALRAPRITLDDPDCVRKTFPRFLNEFAALQQAWRL